MAAAARPVDIYALAASLAKPVVRGLLPLRQAYATVAVACLRAEREGTLQGNGDALDAMRLVSWSLRGAVRSRADEWCRCAARVDTVVWRLIQRKQPIGGVRAEAHDANADAGGLLTEHQVEEILLEALHRQEAFERARVRKTARPYGR